MGTLLAAYIASLLVRSHDDSWPWIDGWGVAAYEVILGLLLVARAFSGLPGRAVPLVLGSAVLTWAAGDVALTWESWGGASAVSPSPADAFYICFYPLAYAAIVLMLRKEIKRLLPATWLDGAIAGLGAAAVCAAFAFHAVVRSLGGDPLGVAVNLVYPIGDVLLLALVVGGTAILPGRRLPWLLFATACAVNGIGDTFNLFGTTNLTGRPAGRDRLQRHRLADRHHPDVDLGMGAGGSSRPAPVRQAPGLPASGMSGRSRAW